MPKEKINSIKKHTSKKISNAKDKKDFIHSDKFLFNTFLFIAVIAVFNFVIYVFNLNGFFKVNKNPTKNIPIVTQSQDVNSNTYSKDDIIFSYPKTSKVEGDSNYLNIDNWGVNFYAKSNNFSDFEKWFNDNFDGKNCSVKSINSDNGTGLSYSLYFIDGIDCKNNGLYMVGGKKIGKIVLGANPNSSYEQVLASIKF